jgi:hypothetical protein
MTHVSIYPRPKNRRPGFSFTEILFAVMILAIGFIMVAAVFPVAIKQTEETVEETTGSSVAKGGASFMQRIAIDDATISTANAIVSSSVYFPPTSGKVVAYTGPSQTFLSPSNQPVAVGSNPFWHLILPSDNRFAFVPFYCRVAGASYAQVTVIAVQCRNAPTFVPADLMYNGTSTTYSSGSSIPNLQGREMTATFINNHGAAPDTITFSADSISGFASPFPAIASADYRACIAEGAYVIIADDSQCQLETVPAGANPKLPGVSICGYVYRVGNNISGTQWELAPGSDMQNGRYSPATTCTAAAYVNGVPNYTTSTLASGSPSPTVRVFVVGRGYSTPTSPSATAMSGPAMDIGAFSSFVSIH